VPDVFFLVFGSTEKPEFFPVFKGKAGFDSDQSAAAQAAAVRTLLSGEFDPGSE
jgi:hypothetical protein